MRPAPLLRDLGMEIGRVAGAATHEHRKLRQRLASALVATFVFDLIGTALMYWLEHGKHDSEITSPFKGFFWVTTQLLTVSSQMKNPVTTGGRIVDIFLEIWALFVVTSVAGSFAAFLQKKRD